MFQEGKKENTGFPKKNPNPLKKKLQTKHFHNLTHSVLRKSTYFFLIMSEYPWQKCFCQKQKWEKIYIHTITLLTVWQMKT